MRAELPTESVLARLDRSRARLIPGEVITNEEVATSDERARLTIAPVSPAAAPTAAYLEPSGAKASTPDAIQIGKAIIDAIAPAARSPRILAIIEAGFEELRDRVCSTSSVNTRNGLAAHRGSMLPIEHDVDLVIVARRTPKRIVKREPAGRVQVGGPVYRRDTE